MRVWLAGAAAGALLAAGCCGYSAHSLLPPHLKTVAVPPAENSTTRPGLGEALTDSLIAAFGADRNLRVTTLDDADLVVNVTVNSYSRTTPAYEADQTVTAYDISISAAVDVQDRVRTETYLKEPLTGRATYDPAQPSTAGDPEEEAALKAAGYLAREIVRRILEKW